MNKNKEKSVFIAAGGTGGHISPAVSIIKQFVKNDFQVVFVTLEKNKEYPDIKNLTDEKIKVVYYDAPKIPSSIKTLIQFFPKLLKCFKILNQEKKIILKETGRVPMAVIGMGGYPSFPTVYWAKRKKIPYYLCEQNARWGKITKLLQKKAKKVFVSFEVDTTKPENYNVLFSGNPLRKDFWKESFESVDEIKVTKKKKSQPSKKSQKEKTILIIGGSQGAKNLNDLFIAIRKEKDSFFNDYKFIVSSGSNMYDEVKEVASSKDEVYSFITDMKSVLLQADIIFSRAGSGVLYEINWARKPAVLFPFPFAADDHQRENALFFENKNLARVIDIRPFDVQTALIKLKDILKSKNFNSNEEERKKVFNENGYPIDAHIQIYNSIVTDINSKEKL